MGAIFKAVVRHGEGFVHIEVSQTHFQYPLVGVHGLNAIGAKVHDELVHFGGIGIDRLGTAHDIICFGLPPNPLLT